MVQAILEGRKTQTRRIVKPQPVVGLEKVKSDLFFDMHTLGTLQKVFKCPYGAVGDVLWVRETWVKNINENSDDFATYEFKADYIGTHAIDLIRWKSPIQMPKAAARIWLEITNVRAERLHDISEQDAITEGIYPSQPPSHDTLPERWFNYQRNVYQGLGFNSIDSFASLWKSAIRAQSWDSNPWVWVIEFKQIQKP